MSIIFFHVFDDFLFGGYVVVYQGFIRFLQAADGLIGTLRATVHRAKRIRITGRAAIEPDHEQDESDLFRGCVATLVDLVDELFPSRPSQVSQGGNDPWREKEFRVSVVHLSDGPFTSLTIKVAGEDYTLQPATFQRKYYPRLRFRFRSLGSSLLSPCSFLPRVVQRPDSGIIRGGLHQFFLGHYVSFL